MVSVLSRGASRNVAVTRAACTSHRALPATICHPAGPEMRRTALSLVRRIVVRLTSQRLFHIRGSRSADKNAVASVETAHSDAAQLCLTGS